MDVTLDIVAVVLLGLAAFAGFSTGLARMVFTAGGWVGAAFVASYGFASAQPSMAALVGSDLLANVLTVLGLFVLSLILFTLIAQIVAGFVDASPLGAVNHSLGLVAAVSVAAAVLSAGWGAYDRYILEGDRPAWVEASVAAHWLDKGMAVLKEAAPAGLVARAEAEAGDLGEGGAVVEEALRLLGRHGPDDTI